ncbi:MAG: LysR family transcriptional regulator [Spirochaetales bacterium]|nr:LysR family transcriptional regulator [Spirochaetales bacterium]
MNLAKLEYFVAVAEYRSFTKAAQKFHVAQPAVSQQIKSLEQEIDVQLIERSSNGFALTKAGAALYEDAQRILNELYFTFDKCRSIAADSQGTLSFGIVGWDENIYLKKLLHLFIQRYPSVNVQLKRVSFNRIEEDLLNREYDCTLSFPYDLTGRKGIRTLHLFESIAHALISKKNPLANKNIVSKDDLVSECCIFFPPDQMERSTEHLMEFFEDTGRPSEVRCVSDRQILDIMICLNEGVAIVPDIWTGPTSLEIRKVPIAGDPHIIDFDLIYNQEIENPTLQLFIDFAIREKEQLRKLL